MLGRTSWNIATTAIEILNENLEDYSPTTLIAGTFVATLFAQKAATLYRDWDSKQIQRALLNKFVQCAEKLPFNIAIPKLGCSGAELTKKINKEVSDILAEVKTDLDRSRAPWEPIRSLPKEGLSDEKILERFAKIGTHKDREKNSGAVYADYDEKKINLLEKVWGKAALTNPMHTSLNPEISLSEVEIISAVQQLLQGDANGFGIMTPGGTFSIIEACTAYVSYAREKLNIQTPEIIIPSSAHVAFHKAARLSGAKLVQVTVDPATGAADLHATEKAITSRTCVIVGSAPSFPYGIFDPIKQLAALAKKHNISMHVDACLGGFNNVFAASIPPCDFSVEGVTSVSIDTHKYGQTPKGSSILVFSPHCPPTLTAHIHLDWVGGMYATPGMAGSRSGADIATTWSVLFSRGADQYTKDTQAIFQLRDALVAEINKTDGIYIPYACQSSVITFRAKDNLNILLVENQLRNAGWTFNVVQNTKQKAEGLHFCLTTVHAKHPGFVDTFMRDLTAAVKYAKANPMEKPKGEAGAYRTLGKGVPFYIQDKIGRGYIKNICTLPEETETKKTLGR